jgi:hypothetical protein
MVIFSGSTSPIGLLSACLTDGQWYHGRQAFRRYLKKTDAACAQFALFFPR